MINFRWVQPVAPAAAGTRSTSFATIPFAARVAWKVLGRRAFAKEYRRVYGEAPAR